jgi:hypothetical protein
VAKVLNIRADIQDQTSGIDQYEIYINDSLIKTVPANEFVDGSYSLAFNTPGDSDVRLLALDRARNSVEAFGSFHTTSVAAPKLRPLAKYVSTSEPLLILGSAEAPNTDVTVYVKYESEEPVATLVKSDIDLNFIVTVPVLKPGAYDIWAETGSGEYLASSSHEKTEATSKLLSIGSMTAIASNFFILISIIFVLLIVGAYLLGRHHLRAKDRSRIRSTLAGGDGSRVLTFLKKRLENHLEILQHTRRDRILTPEEKEIKEAIEDDLDEVDKALLAAPTEIKNIPQSNPAQTDRLIPPNDSGN